MRVLCPNCEATLRIADESAGDLLRCPKCRTQFEVPEEDDDRDSRKRKPKKKKKPFPIIQTIAVVSVLAMGGLIAFFAMGGLKDKKADTPAPSETASNDANVPAPGVWPPPEAPPEVTTLFHRAENEVEAQSAMQSVPVLEIAKGSSKGLSIAAPMVKKVPAKADDPKLDIEGIKKSCAYIKVSAGLKSGTGSGFLVRVDKGVALVATNFHVIEAATTPAPGEKPAITAVFDSGLPTQTDYAAEIVATDPVVDLAVLRIKGNGPFPTPIEPALYEEPVETSPILICGFPFGEAFASGGRSPTITIGKGSVSSLRRDREGVIHTVQIDGSVNFGNSGGPIVSATSGRLVGVVVKKMTSEQGSNTGIGMAIPAAELASALSGRIAAPVFKPALVDKADSVYHLQVPISDPLKRIKSVNLHVWSGTGRAPAGEKDENGRWKPLAGSREVELPPAFVLFGSALAEFRAPSKDTTIVLQTALQTATGESIVSQPVTYRAKLEQRVSSDTVDIGQFHPGTDKQGKVVSVRARLNGVSRIWNLGQLVLMTPQNGQIPEKMVFLVSKEINDQLGDVFLEAIEVRVTARVGGSHPMMGTVLRAFRIDVMDGNRVVRSVPSADGWGLSPLYAIDHRSDQHAGHTITFEAMMAPVVLPSQDPQYFVCYASGMPAQNVYFTSTGEMAKIVAGLEFNRSQLNKVRLTVRVEERRIKNLPAIAILKIELLDTNGAVQQTAE